MTLEDRWPHIEEALVRLGVDEQRRWHVKVIRGQLEKIASQGIQTMPDFTLHNVTHSDNLISILDRLKTELNFSLQEYEAYLLAAAAYLHDLGMFFTERRFQQEIWPEINTKLRFCPRDKCDNAAHYHLDEETPANRIRLTHHLLSAYWLQEASPNTFGIDTADQPYLITICRGHRGANLREAECNCYKTTWQAGEQIRLGLIAGLLRLSDALDFYANRAPQEVFESKILDFLQNPIALSHWIKHYFVDDPFIRRVSDQGNIILECQLILSTPMNQKINGKSYLEFLRPLFDKHIEQANQDDLNIEQYPPEFTTALGIVGIRASLTPKEWPAKQGLPKQVLAEIKLAGSSDINAFLKSRRDALGRPAARTTLPLDTKTPPIGSAVVGNPTSLKRILVLCPLFGASSIFYSNLLSAIIQGASRYGYELNIQPINDVYSKRPLKDYAHLPSLSGIIAITSQIEKSTWLDECRAAGIPIALIHDNVDVAKLAGSTVVSYLLPNLDGLRDLVSHLIRDHQRRNICVVMVRSARSISHRIRQQKLDIIRNTIMQDVPDLDVTDRNHLFQVRSYTHEEGRNIVSEILEANPTVDAIICLADVTAVGILQELKKRMRDDILVTGFDNIDMASHFQLTSVDQQLLTTGDRAVVDLHNAIHNGVFGIERPTYIPTTLIVRDSCCAPSSSQLPVQNPIQRFAVYYRVEDSQVLNAIRNVHCQIYQLNGSHDNTISLLGNAPLFPPHITIKGIFQIDSHYHAQDLIKSLTKVIMPLKPFSIRIKDVRSYPEMSVSLGLDEVSDQEMRDLQNLLLPVIDKYRCTDVIEPEFRAAAQSDDAERRACVATHGEPFIGKLFNPHITVVSGVKNTEASDRMVIESFINTGEISGLELEINKLTVMYETTLGGSWAVLKDIPLSAAGTV